MFAYVDPNVTNPYAQMLWNWSSGDYVFQPNQGPSFPGHQYLIAGQSGGLNNGSFGPPNLAPYAMADNTIHGGTGPIPPDDPSDPEEEPWTTNAGPYCSPPPSKPPYVATLNMLGPYNQNEQANPTPLPCDNYATIFDNLSPSALPPNSAVWEYHSHSVGSYWDAPSAIYRFANPGGTGKSVPNNIIDAWANQFVKTDVGYDIATGKYTTPNMPELTYITPCPYDSDHPDSTSSDGPGWVAWLVNIIGGSSVWPNTAIFVVWDDWGGWYDDVPPGQLINDIYCMSQNDCGTPGYADPNEWGFRVPLIAISAYPALNTYNMTHGGYVSHIRRSSSAILSFIESNFNEPSLKTDDSQNDNLADLFDPNLLYPGVPFTPINVQQGYAFTPHYNKQGQPYCPAYNQQQ